MIQHQAEHKTQTQGHINHQDNDTTKAVVIMYELLGSVEKHLKQCAELYANHPIQKCAVVYGTAGTATIIFRHNADLTAMVLDSVKKAAGIIRQMRVVVVVVVLSSSLW